MPTESYYCADNFFKKMTDLESPKKNNDCYFYYYSTCTKGDSCTFRHEPSALGCETMCSFWREGKCLNVHCNFRHMELRKNRKTIPCYWESKPGGCLKPHCPFQHQQGKAADENSSDKSINSNDNKLDDSQDSDSFKGSSNVDSLVVNFEEESDNESATNVSPVTKLVQNENVKTLEELKLEKVQAEAAAYYSLPVNETTSQLDGDDLRQRILNRMKHKKPVNKKLSSEEIAAILGDDSISIEKRRRKLFDDEPSAVLGPNKFRKQNKASGEIKIKTLEEIRAERSKKQSSEDENTTSESTYKRKRSPITFNRHKLIKLDKDRGKDEESEVSSTSVDEQTEETSKKPQKIIRKLNLRKITEPKRSQDDVVSSNNKEPDSEVEEKLPDDLVTKTNEIKTTCITRSPNETSQNTIDSNLQSDKQSADEVKDITKEEIVNKEIPLTTKPSDCSNANEDVLLLDDDDDMGNVTFKAEDDLLNEIDNLLDD